MEKESYRWLAEKERPEYPDHCINEKLSIYDVLDIQFTPPDSQGIYHPGLGGRPDNNSFDTRIRLANVVRFASATTTSGA